MNQNGKQGEQDPRGLNRPDFPNRRGRSLIWLLIALAVAGWMWTQFSGLGSATKIS